VNLRSLKKISRSKRKCSRRFQHNRVDRIDEEGNKDGTVLLRGPYFKALREERKLQRLLALSLPSSNSNPDRKEYKRIRFVYYCILPIFFSRLNHPVDRQVSIDLERYYYSLLNTINYNKGRPRLTVRLNWDLRHFHRGLAIAKTHRGVSSLPSKALLSDVPEIIHGEQLRHSQSL